jgi:DNA-binding IclR family transcriptional regulator
MPRSPTARAPARKAGRRAAAGSAPRSAGGTVSMARGLQLLELLAGRETPASLSELSEALGVNKAIGLRLLGTMEESGYVFRHGESGLYELTYKLANLGLRKVAGSRLLDQSSAILRRLAERTGELVRLAVVEQDERITWVLAHVGEQRTLQIDPNYGLDIRPHIHAAGKAWVATLPPVEAWEIIRAHGIDRFTVHSKVERGAIEADLAAVRSRGYATSIEEQEIGVAAIAAPVMVDMLAGGRRCVGSVSLAAPTHRLAPAALEAHAPLVIEAAAALAAVWPLGDRARACAAAGRRGAAVVQGVGIS